MSDKDEIEKLRACITVDRAIIQAMLEELPVSILEALNANITFKLEHFTVRTIYSTMPEAFVEAQRDSANAWISTLQVTLAKRRPQQS
jgi:hypothetical protein